MRAKRSINAAFSALVVVLVGTAALAVGAAPDASGHCPPGTQPLPGTTACTHGPDPAPRGAREAQPLHAALAADADDFRCDGDGTSGPRIEVLYVHAKGTDRLEKFRDSFNIWLLDADRIFRDTASDTAGERSLRFVHDENCVPTITGVAVGERALGRKFWNTVAAVSKRGFNRTDRKYMMFVDSKAVCGYGSIHYDDIRTDANPNDSGPSWSRVDRWCWTGDVIAHELMHNLGGVQDTAPNASGGRHCTDEYDVMCYSDEPFFPDMREVCLPWRRDTTRFDCNGDDYFNTSPSAGSYLDNHWNTANNRFLIGAPAPAPCPDLALEPDESADDPTPLVEGVTQSRAFCEPWEQDVLSFTGIAGRTYLLETSSLGEGSDTWVNVLTPEGEQVAGDRCCDPTSRVFFRPRSSGTYNGWAFDGSGRGGSSLRYDITLTSTAAPHPSSPAPPTDVRVLDVGRKRVSIEWTAPDAEDFVVYANRRWTSSTYDPGTTLYGLRPATAYCFEVEARNDYGLSEVSEPVCAKTKR